jgi:hypothetical protein
MNTCPCCSEVLLRHARQNRIYWFCTYCWQEMPDPELEFVNHQVALPQLPRLVDLVGSR